MAADLQVCRSQYPADLEVYRHGKTLCSGAVPALNHNLGSHIYASTVLAVKMGKEMNKKVDDGRHITALCL